MDPDAHARFRALWDAHHAGVLAYLRRRAPAQARDLTAETFLVVWRRLDEVPADALPWLYATARNLMLNERRRERRREDVLGRVAGEAAPAGGDPAERSAGSAGSALVRAFARLRPGDRELLALMAWEGLDAGRAAQVLGIARPLLAVRLHRARRRLAAALADLGEPLDEGRGGAGAGRPREGT